MPAKVAFMQLSSCWGCHQSLLNAHLGLLPVLPELEVVYWPAVVDFKLDSLKARADGEIVVGFIEGHARTEADVQNTLLMRKKCQIIVAFGTCANHGSVAGLANLHSREELLKCKFVEKPSIQGSDVPGGWPNEYHNISEITDRVYTVPQLIDFEVKIPGCPPKTENIVASVVYLLGLLSPGSENRDPNTSVCEACSLNASGCLLDKGELCFGPITAGGCSLKCPESGDPCVGCFKVTSYIGGRVQQLMSALSSLGSLDRVKAVDIKKFLLLYLGLASMEHMYFKGDPIQRLAKEPGTFNTKSVSGQNALVISQTGNEMIDNMLGLLLFKLRDSPELKYEEKNVCDHCDRTISSNFGPVFKRDYEGMPAQDICFIEQGYACMGPATHAGCGTICPNNANAPCLGCYGPPDKTPDQGGIMVSMYPSIRKNIIDLTGCGYRFSYPSSPRDSKGKYSKEG